MRCFDCHTHVNFPAFDADRAAVIERARKTGISMVNVGTARDTSTSAVALAEGFEEGVYAAAGVHPIHANESFHDENEGAERIPPENFDYDFYARLATNPKVVAIGECGLDYFRLEGDLETLKANQKSVFEAQVALASEVGKPLMVHSRDAFADTLHILRALKAEGGIAHSFVRTVEEARALLELGFYFTFAGNITYKPTAEKPSADEVIRYIPLDRILSETDAPYLAPVPFRGGRNEPAYVTEVVKKIAEIRNLAEEDVAERLFENAKAVFKI